MDVVIRLVERLDDGLDGVPDEELGGLVGRDELALRDRAFLLVADVDQDDLGQDLDDPAVNGADRPSCAALNRSGSP
ncbi:MAG: hypothetical protein MUF27_03065 [Acidobacteria bacterium]|nr:hypothetical protein [Acidobacteriota bacterium]